MYGGVYVCLYICVYVFLYIRMVYCALNHIHKYCIFFYNYITQNDLLNLNHVDTHLVDTHSLMWYQSMNGIEIIIYALLQKQKAALSAF